MPATDVTFRYGGEIIDIRSVSSDDHLLQIMRNTNSFYERDVLVRINDRIGARDHSGAAIDAGAFIGTHSLFFSKICKCNPVLSFEANPDTFPVLVRNIKVNRVEESVSTINKALGASAGRATILGGDSSNQGSASIIYESLANRNQIDVTTIDIEVAAALTVNQPVALIKIDVEGAELEVLRGSKETIRNHRPILCVEVHTFRNLVKVLAMLRRHRYWIVDCLGYSPTYIIEPSGAPFFRRRIVNWLWLLRAALPLPWRRLKWYVGRTAQILSTGKWNLPPLDNANKRGDIA